MYNSIVLIGSMRVRTPVWFSQKYSWKTDLSLHFGRGGLGCDVLGVSKSKRKKTENIGRQEITSQYFSIRNSDKKIVCGKPWLSTSWTDTALRKAFAFDAWIY